MWKLRPSDNSFFDMLYQLSLLIPQGSELLNQVITEKISVGQAMLSLNELQNKSNEITAEILDKVGKSYVPPMDREDIFSLAKQLNSLLRILHATVERMMLYHLNSPNQNSQNLIHLLTQTINQVPEIIHDLSHISSKAEEIIHWCNVIDDNENEADFYYRHALAELFDTCHSTVEIIKWRDIFQHLEKAFDACERLADSVKGAVMKYV